MSLGETIHQLRGEKHLSQGELADLLEVSRQSVSKWETDASVPDLDKLVKLSQVFELTLDELVRGEKSRPDPEATTSAPPPPTGERPFPPRKIAGTVLLCMAFLVVLVCTLMGGLLEGLVLCTPFLFCGAICFWTRRHPGLWCAWALYFMADLFFRIGTGITWRMISLTPIFTPEMNDARLAFAWVEFLLLVLLVAVTVFRLGKRPLLLRRRDGWLLVGAFAILLLLELPVLQRWSWGGLTMLLYRILPGDTVYSLTTCLLDALRTALFTALLTLGLRALRGRRGTPSERA